MSVGGYKETRYPPTVVRLFVKRLKTKLFVKKLGLYVKNRPSNTKLKKSNFQLWTPKRGVKTALTVSAQDDDFHQ